MSKPRELLIRSKDRISGTSDNFRVEIPQPIQGLKELVLLSIHLPNTLYNVRTGVNDKIYFTYDAPPVLYVATLPEGAYDINSFLAAIGAEMTNETGQTFSASYDALTMKITITATQNWTLGFGVESANYIMGFSDITYPTGLSVTADNVVRLDFPNYLLVEILEMGISSVETTSKTVANFTISMTTNSQGLEVFNRNVGYNQQQCYNQGVIQNLTIRLRRDSGEFVNLNGGDWSILMGMIYG